MHGLSKAIYSVIHNIHNIVVLTYRQLDSNNEERKQLVVV